MFGGVLLLALVVFGLSWLFGFGKPERFVKFIVWLIFGPVLLGLLYSEWLSFYSDATFLVKVIIWVGVLFVILLSLRFLFPSSPYFRRMSETIWDFVVFFLTFPFRLIWRSGRQVSEGERNRARLQRYRPAVGGRPPLRNDLEGRLNRRR
jgi:hypothetical protein